VLITEIVEALQGSATFEYRELELELHGLRRALHELGNLQPPAGQEAAINGIKVAALMCQYPLEEFKKSLMKYQGLSVTSEQAKLDKVKNWVRKAQWSVSMNNDVQKLRAYIAAHVASLNMRLMTLGISTLAVAKADLSNRSEEHKELVQQGLSQISSLGTIVTTRVLPQMKGLMELGTKIWASSLRILEYFTKLEDGTLAIDVKHTWFQEPLKLEDALGRVLPVPVEYGWTKLHAIILDQFRSGPGHAKVFAGEYEVFSTNDASQLITEESFGLLRPGTSLTMALVIGIYSGMPHDWCPKPGCSSALTVKKATGGFSCERCQTWFGQAQTAIPRPFRLLDFKQDLSQKSVQKNKRKRVTKPKTVDVLQAIREDRKWFKNVRVHRTDMSETVKLVNVTWENEAPDSKKTKLHLARKPESELQVATLCPSKSPHQSESDLWDAVWNIIAEVLWIQEPIQDKSSLLRFGLDSICAMQIIARVRKELGIPLTLRLLVHGTVEEIKDMLKTGIHIKRSAL
jgi:aryl carrier-like protein